MIYIPINKKDKVDVIPDMVVFIRTIIFIIQG